MRIEFRNFGDQSSLISMAKAVKQVASMKIACIILWAEDRTDIFIWLFGVMAWLVFRE